MSTVRGMKNEPWNEDWCVLGVCIEDLVADLDLERWHLSCVLHALTSLRDSHSSNISGTHQNGIFIPGYVPLAIQSSSQVSEIVSIFWAEMKQSWSIGGGMTTLLSIIKLEERRRKYRRSKAWDKEETTASGILQTPHCIVFSRVQLSFCMLSSENIICLGFPILPASEPSWVVKQLLNLLTLAIFLSESRYHAFRLCLNGREFGLVVNI